MNNMYIKQEYEEGEVPVSQKVRTTKVSSSAEVHQHGPVLFLPAGTFTTPTTPTTITHSGRDINRSTTPANTRTISLSSSGTHAAAGPCLSTCWRPRASVSAAVPGWDSMRSKLDSMWHQSRAELKKAKDEVEDAVRCNQVTQQRLDVVTAQKVAVERRNQVLQQQLTDTTAEKVQAERYSQALQQRLLQYSARTEQAEQYIRRLQVGGGILLGVCWGKSGMCMCDIVQHLPQCWACQEASLWTLLPPLASNIVSNN